MLVTVWRREIIAAVGEPVGRNWSQNERVGLFGGERGKQDRGNVGRLTSP